MKVLFLSFLIVFIRCNDGGEEVEGRTTPANDSPYIQNDTINRMNNDSTDTSNQLGDSTVNR